MFVMCFYVSLHDSGTLLHSLLAMTTADGAVHLYHKISHISHTLVGDKIVYHSNVVGAYNCKVRQETFKYLY